MISEKGYSLVRQFEGLRTLAYKCPAGIRTIGYGHTLNVRAGQVITKAQAEEFLHADLSKCDAAISRLVTVSLKQCERDALASFIFNVGVNAFQSSTMLRKINADDMQGAANEFLRWNKATDPNTRKLIVLNGLTKRREAEKQLFEGKA